MIDLSQVTKAWYHPYRLVFKKPVLTSRGSMRSKQGFYLYLTDGVNTGVGECSFIEGLSVESTQTAENELTIFCDAIHQKKVHTNSFKFCSSVQFALECAALDLAGGGRKILFNTEFTAGKRSIPINGLVWMGDEQFMTHQMEDKTAQGFRCVKMKVGALSFETELAILKNFRKHYPAENYELRLDANGAFNAEDIFEKLEILSQYNIHSIEQPVAAGQYNLMKEVCRSSPIPVALDEELIHLAHLYQLESIAELKPKYVIIKPSLMGGFAMGDKIITIAEQHHIGWWATSALESNIGLNAIAQWVSTKHTDMIQGLGTGGLYVNNVTSPLYIEHGHLHYNPFTAWGDIPQ